MNKEDTIRMAHEAGLHLATDVNWMPIIGIEYAEKLIALARADERAKLQGEIETLYAMYELASKQRDYLMEQQNAQVAAMRGKMQ
jgi:hypothetical protein